MLKLTPEQRGAMIATLRDFPPRLEALVGNLSEQDLTTPYMAHEWTVVQNVHHLADSHMNAYIRMKLCLTEDQPILKPYDQDEWAKFPDASKASFQDSLAILRGLHQRWTELLDGLNDEQWARTGTHVERGLVTVEDQLQTYAKHCDAHIDQIQRTLAAQK